MPQSKEDKQVKALRKLVFERARWAGKSPVWRFGIMVYVPVSNPDTSRLDREISTLRRRIPTERLIKEGLLS